MENPFLWLVKADFGEPFPLFASRNPPRVQTLPNPTGLKGASAALIMKIDDDDNDDIENNADSDNHHQYHNHWVQTLPNLSAQCASAGNAGKFWSISNWLEFDH